MIEAGDEEHGVDVGSDDLLFGGVAGGAAGEPARTRQDGADPGIAASHRRLDRHPVADRGEIDALRCLVPQPSRDARQPVAVSGEDPIDVRVLERDARRDETVGRMRRE